MHQFSVGAVELAVGDTAACTHQLHIAGLDHRAGAHAVAVRQRTLQYIGKDFHIVVWMRAKTLTWLDAILVDHAQVGKADLLGVPVAGEGKRVAGTEPAVLGDTTVSCLAYLHHGETPGQRLRNRGAAAPLRRCAGGVSASP